MIASHLLKYCDYLTDTGMGDFELRYLKNKEKYEIDFIILRNKKAFLAIEAKYNDDQPSPSWGKFLGNLGCSHGVQLVMKQNVYKIHQYPHYKIAVMSAAHFLKYLI